MSPAPPPMRVFITATPQMVGVHTMGRTLVPAAAEARSLGPKVMVCPCALCAREASCCWAAARTCQKCDLT